MWELIATLVTSLIEVIASYYCEKSKSLLPLVILGFITILLVAYLI